MEKIQLAVWAGEGGWRGTAARRVATRVLHTTPALGACGWGEGNNGGGTAGRLARPAPFARRASCLAPPNRTEQLPGNGDSEVEMRPKSQNQSR